MSDASTAVSADSLVRPTPEGFVTLYYGPPKASLDCKLYALGLVQKTPMLFLQAPPSLPVGGPPSSSSYKIELERAILNAQHAATFQRHMTEEGAGLVYAVFGGLVYLEHVSLDLSGTRCQTDAILLYDVLKGAATGVRHYPLTPTPGSA